MGHSELFYLELCEPPEQQQRREGWARMEADAAARVEAWIAEKAKERLAVRNLLIGKEAR